MIAFFKLFKFIHSFIHAKLLQDSNLVGSLQQIALCLTEISIHVYNDLLIVRRVRSCRFQRTIIWYISRQNLFLSITLSFHSRALCAHCQNMLQKTFYPHKNLWKFNSIEFPYSYISTNLETYCKNMFDCRIPSQKKDKRSRLLSRERERDIAFQYHQFR